MGITGIKDYYAAGATKRSKNDSEINMVEALQNEVQNWKEKLKNKLDEELKNDQEKNLKMSDKQWRALMNKVDRAIDANIQVTRENSKTKQAEANNESQKIDQSDFKEFLKENSQLSTEDFLSLLTSDKLGGTADDSKKSRTL